MKFLEAHQGDRVIIGRFISPLSVRWLGFFLFIVGLICLIGVSASFPFILSTIGFAAGVTLAVLGISLGLAAMFAFQITTHSAGDVNNHSKALTVIRRKQDADIKFMDFSTVPPTEIATAKISGEGKGHAITISSKGETQTIVTDDLKPGMEVKVGDASLKALPRTRCSQYIYLNYLLSSPTAQFHLNSSNTISSTEFTIGEGHINTGLANKLSDTKLVNLSGQTNIGASNKIQSITVTNSGKLKMGASNTIDKVELSINQSGQVNIGESNTLNNSNILVKAGEINGGASNKIKSITVTNNGKLKMGASNTINNVELLTNENSQLNLGASNTINSGKISVESGMVGAGMSNTLLNSFFTNKSGAIDLGMSNKFNKVNFENTQSKRNFGMSRRYG